MPRGGARPRDQEREAGHDHDDRRLRQQMWYLVTMLVIFVPGHLYVALWVLTQPVRSALPVWMITAAELIAVVAMVVCLLVINPQLRGELVERDA